MEQHLLPTEDRQQPHESPVTPAVPVASPLTCPGPTQAVPVSECQGNPAAGSSQGPSVGGALEKEAGDDNPQGLALVQRIACDILLCCLGLPASWANGLPLLRYALDPAAPLGPVQRVTGVLLLLVCVFTPAVLLALYILKPYATAAQRQLFWAILYGCGPSAFQLAATVLNRPGRCSVRLLLLSMAGGMGLSDTLVPTFAAWLPPTVSMYTAVHAWNTWGTRDVQALLFDLLEFNLYPVAVYAGLRAVNNTLQRLGVAAVYSTFRRLGGAWVARRQRFWTGASAVVSQMLVGCFMTWVLTVGPVQLPALLNPVEILDSAKDRVLQLLRVASEPAILQGALGVAVCFAAVPALQLLAVHATRRRAARHQECACRPASGAPSSHLPTGGCLAGPGPAGQQERLALDQVACLAAAPVQLLLVPRMVMAAIWPAPGVGALGQAVGVLSAVLTAVMYLRHLDLVLHHPAAALSQRGVWWAINCAGAPVALAAGTTALGLSQSWLAQPQQHMLLQAFTLGYMDVPYHMFGLWLPILSGGFYAVHAHHNWLALPWSWLALDALEFNITAILAYAAARLAWAACDAATGRLASKLVQLLYGPSFTPEDSRWCRMLAIVAWHAVGAAVTVWVMWFGGVSSPSWMGGVMSASDTKHFFRNQLEGLVRSAGAYMVWVQTSLAVVGLGVFLLAVTSLQALVLNNPAFRNPRQRRYEACKAKVMALGEGTMSRLARLGAEAGPQELREALLASLSHMVDGCFPGCTLLLVLLEEGAGVDTPGATATRYLVTPTPEAGRLSPAALVELRDVPSVQGVLRSKQVLAANMINPKGSGWSDWDALAEECSLHCFLVVPLHCADQDLGALLVTSGSPVSLDKYTHKLALDLGHALSQAVYTLACIGQMRAGDRIIKDMLPDKVAEQLKRRMVTSSTPFSPSAPRGPEGQAQFPHLPQGHSTHPQLRTSHEGSHAISSGALPQRLSSEGPLGGGEVPVVYKSWHPAVSVLFADISGYTALSTSVEPEQVMMLLHELFSKFDNLCSQYGVYKVETIGDCYMACTGLLTEDPDHANHLVEFGQSMLRVAAGVSHPLGGSVHIRVGVHSGRVMSGIVGSIRARYCLFGDTVNTASRMESTGVVDHIQVTQATYQLLGPALQGCFQLRQAVEVKGKGVMATYLLRGQEEGAQ